MGCPAQRSTVADAISGLTATNVTARTRAADGWRALRRGIAPGLVAVLVSVALSACGSSPAMAPGTALVVSAPVRIAHTRLGAIGYRVVGTGPPLVLIMGYAGTIGACSKSEKTVPGVLSAGVVAAGSWPAAAMMAATARGVESVMVALMVTWWVFLL